MDIQIFVLTTLFDVKGDLRSKNVGVTTNIHDAEAHVKSGACGQNSYDTLTLAGDFKEGAVISEVVMFMREASELINADVKRSLA